MKTLIFDLGMVLVHFRWREFLTDMGYEGEKKEGLAKAMFQNPLWQEFDRGVMGDANGAEPGKVYIFKLCRWRRIFL